MKNIKIAQKISKFVTYQISQMLNIQHEMKMTYRGIYILRTI